MQNNISTIQRFLIFTFFVCLTFPVSASAQNLYSTFQNAGVKESSDPNSPSILQNPLVINAAAGCQTGNLQSERFEPAMSPADRIKMCQAFASLIYKLNQTRWTQELAREIQSIWNVFSREKVDIRLMPAGYSREMIAMAAAFPDKTDARYYKATIYLRPEKSGDSSFLPVVMHELRHILDFFETWRDKTSLPSMEIERRAYRLAGRLIQETPEKERMSGLPKFWKDSWRKLSEDQINLKREKAIARYLNVKKLYRDMAADPARKTLDFSYLKNSAEYINNGQMKTWNVKKDGERLPVHHIMPETISVIPQNITETNLNFERPRDPRDPKEVLRVALENEKKLYYGMSNFVYEQSIDLNCLKKGRITASFAANTTVARTSDGDSLTRMTSYPSALPCVLNFSDLKTDFDNTFWASPALDKMPIYSNGFQEIDGKKLAVYTVLEPDDKLFNQLADEYPHIRPFRVIVGTIYVSPEDGQIVRFAGTSYPEENVTGSYAERVRCTYWVKALRQKVNIEGGLWVTVHIGTVAVASVEGKIQPFNYTVKFNNYRQSKTDMKILDDEYENAATIAAR